MLNHPEWAEEIQRRDEVTSGFDEFTLIDESAINFTNAMTQELNRVLKKKSLWRVRQSLLVPLNETDIFKHFGHLGSFEVPEGALKEALMGRDMDRDVWEFLRDSWLYPEKYIRDISQYPQVSSWLSQILRSPSTEFIDQERKEFGTFVQAMRKYDSGKLFPMPRFKYEDLSCWRVFFQIFPESARLLETMFKYPHHWSLDQLKAGFLLASTLASADDQTVSNKGNDLLLLIGSQLNVTRVYKYEQFAAIRELFFTSVEAHGTQQAVNRFINFIHRHPIDWEMRLTREYYTDSTDSTTERALRAKLKNPKPRDIQAIPILEMLLNHISRTSRNV
jgi:hypothetical protein